jgi:hypothetical protein
LAGTKEGCSDDVEWITVKRPKDDANPFHSTALTEIAQVKLSQYPDPLGPYGLHSAPWCGVRSTVLLHFFARADSDMAEPGSQPVLFHGQRSVRFSKRRIRTPFIGLR